MTFSDGIILAGAAWFLSFFIVAHVDRVTARTGSMLWRMTGGLGASLLIAIGLLLSPLGH